jgi:hypothetical protein
MKAPRRWRLRALFTSWIVYWILLVIVKLGPAARAIWRATHAGGPPDVSTVALNFSNFNFVLKVTSPGMNWSGSASLLAIAAWIAVPPLLLWLIWVTQQPRPAVVEDDMQEPV